MKLSVSKMLKHLTKWGTKHTPEILHAAGFAAGASALVLTATGTVKAVREIDEKKPATKKDAAKLVAKYYIPAGVAALASVTCHTCAAREYIRRNTMLASWGTMMCDKLNKLEEKNVEVLGEKKAQKIQDEMALDELKRTDVSNVIETGHGNTLFVDQLTGQVIRSDYHYIMDLVNKLNYGIANAIAAERGSRTSDGRYPSLWEYEKLMGERETDNANHYGWYDGKLIRITCTYDKADNGEPIGYLRHHTLFGVRPDYLYISGSGC